MPCLVRGVPNGIKFIHEMKKTIRQWFSGHELEAEIIFNATAQENAEFNLKTLYSSASEALYSAFWFDQTLQGEQFWLDVAEKVAQTERDEHAAQIQATEDDKEAEADAWRALRSEI